MKFHFAQHAGVALLAVTSSLSAEDSDSRTEALKGRIIAHARTVTAEDYAYTRTVQTESIEGDKTEKRVIVERWDPSKPAEQRWTLISIDGQPPNADQTKNYRKELPKRRQAYYGRVAAYFAKPTTSAMDTRGRTTFRFASLPKESVMVSDADISANARGEVFVDTTGAIPFVEEVRFNSTKATRVKLVAKIDRFETTTRYRLMPDGKPVPVELVSEMSGSMLGQQGRIRTRIAFTDHRAVGR